MVVTKLEPLYTPEYESRNCNIHNDPHLETMCTTVLTIALAITLR